jgi:hypothetical protein
MICPSCVAECPDGSSLCCGCGKPLPRPSDAEATSNIEQRSEQHSAGGSLHLGDVGMIKDSTLQSETNVDSHNQTETNIDSHDHIETHFNIDSHDVTGAPVVSGTQIINIGDDRTRATKVGEHCPLCGSLVKDDYFRCKSCGRNFICKAHMDKEHLVCYDCHARKFGTKKAEWQTAAPGIKSEPGAEPVSPPQKDPAKQGPYSPQGTREEKLEPPLQENIRAKKKLPMVPFIAGVVALLALIAFGYHFMPSKKEATTTTPASIDAPTRPEARTGSLSQSPSAKLVGPTRHSPKTSPAASQAPDLKQGQDQKQKHTAYPTLEKETSPATGQLEPADATNRKIIRVRGIALESTDPNVPNAARELGAKRAARIVALRNLAEQVYGLKVEGETVVKDLMSKSDEVRTSVNAFIQGAKIVSERRMGNGSYEVEVELDAETLRRTIYK